MQKFLVTSFDYRSLQINTYSVNPSVLQEQVTHGSFVRLWSQLANAPVHSRRRYEHARP